MTDYTAFEQNIKTRTKILHTSLGYVVDALAVAAFGAACGMMMGLTGLPTLLFLALEFYLIYQFHMDIEMGQLHHAEMIFSFFAFFVGISLSPILGLANITLGFTSIICAMAITLLILGLTSTIASITARQYLDDTSLDPAHYQKYVISMLIGLLILGVFLPYTVHAPITLIVYSSISAIVFTCFLFLDIIKSLCYNHHVTNTSEDLADLIALKASMSIFLDVINIFEDLLLLFIASEQNNQNTSFNDVSSFQTIVGLFSTFCFTSYIIYKCFFESSSDLERTQDPVPANAVYAEKIPGNAKEMSTNLPVAQVVSEEIESDSSVNGCTIS